MNNFVDIFGDSLDNVKTVYDFVEKEDYEIILNYLNEVAKTRPENVMHYRSGDFGFEDTKEISDLGKKYKTKIIETANDVYGQKFVNGKAISPMLLTIHAIGSSSHPHTDILEQGLKPQEPDGDEFIGWRDGWDGYLACNIYINDNYSDGQVYFPERDYEIKPKANSLVMWAGNKHFIHGVKDPVTADRYTWTTWIKFEDFDKYTS
jgi:hypothetical protein